MSASTTQTPGSKPADVAKRIEYLLLEHGFEVLIYFGLNDIISFVLVSSKREGYDLLLQVPSRMQLRSVKSHALCQIELQKVNEEWIKRAGEQTEIDVKYMSRTIRTLLENIDQNVKVHQRIDRLNLAWFDPVRKLLFVEMEHSVKRFVVTDIARCPDWLAKPPSVWFSVPLNDLFSKSFSLWEESVLTGEWLRSSMWDDQKRLWSVMNKNWSILLGDRLLRPNEPHPMTDNYYAMSKMIDTLQKESIKLRQLSLQDGRESERAEKTLEEGGELLLKRHRTLIAGMLTFGDALEEWLTFFPSFQYTLNLTRKYTDTARTRGSNSIQARAGQAVNSILDWLGGELEQDADPTDEKEDGGEALIAVSKRTLPILSERPLPHRLAKLHKDEDSDTEIIETEDVEKTNDSRPADVEEALWSESEDVNEDVEEPVVVPSKPIVSTPVTQSKINIRPVSRPSSVLPSTTRKTPSYFEQEVARLEREEAEAEAEAEDIEE
jgi:hypothetical protein